MSEPSDSTDKAWTDDADENQPDENGATEDAVHRVDTVPPPESGDAYSADTVIRDVPREALDAIRDKKKASEKRRAGTASQTQEPIVSEEKIAAEVAAVAAPEKKSVETKSSEVRAEPTKPRAATPTAHAPKAKGPRPVTGSELTIAFAAAIALIVVGFYIISGAF